MVALTLQFTCVARLGSVNFTLSRRSRGRVGKRASSVFPGEGGFQGSCAVDLVSTPLPELRFACSTLPIQTFFAKGEAVGDSNESCKKSDLDAGAFD